MLPGSPVPSLQPGVPVPRLAPLFPLFTTVVSPSPSGHESVCSSCGCDVTVCSVRYDVLLGVGIFFQVKLLIQQNFQVIQKYPSFHYF